MGMKANLENEPMCQVAAGLAISQGCGQAGGQVSRELANPPAANEHDRAGQTGEVADDVAVAVLGGGEGRTGTPTPGR
jgi:hypothetical protein